MGDNENRKVPPGYDVFISYRHKPLDSRICKKLHTLLEAYKPARRFKSAKIRRVFRDEEELPAAGILSDTIKEALLSARYLVVVCSPDTPESGWVDREVRTFIELGRSDKIYALLIKGNPGESFPKSLLTIGGIENRTLDINAPGENQMLKSLKREMLKIVAAVSDIPYDYIRVSNNRRAIRRFIFRAAILSVFFAASGLYSLFQWAQASYYSLYAQREELLINNVINGMTGSLPESLKDIPEAQPVLAGILQENLDYLGRMASIDPHSIDKQKSAGESYLNLANIWIRLGDLGKAEEYVGKAVSIYIKLADEKANPTGKEDLVNCYSMAGRYMEYSGKNNAAVSYFNKAISLADEALQKKPDPVIQRSIADNSRNLGDCYAASADMDKAGKYYADSVSYYETLVSGGQMTEKDLAGIYGLIAQTLNGDGQYASALDYYVKDADILKNAAKTDRTVNKDLGLCDINQGLVYLSSGNPEKAIDRFKLAAGIFEEYCKTERDTQAELYESQAYSSMGSTYQRLGQYEAAGESFDQCGTILNGLDPGNPIIKGMIARNYQNIGLNYKYLSRDRDAADSYEKAISFYKELIGEDKDYALRADLGGALNDLGTVYLSETDYKSAESAFRDALAQYDSYVKSGGANEDMNVAISSHNAGLALYNQARFSDSNDFTFKAADIYEGMLSNKPDPNVKTALAECYNLIGSCYALQYDLKSALSYHQKSADFYADLSGGETELAYQKGYAVSLYSVATDEIMSGEFDNAEKSLITALRLCYNIIDGSGGDFYSTYLSFNSFYYMFFGKNERDKALDIAGQAYDASPGDSFARQTYGYALALAGKGAEAETHLAALVKGNPANLVFMKYDLAMFQAKGISCEVLERIISDLGK